MKSSLGYVLAVFIFGFNVISLSTFAAVTSTAETPLQIHPEALCPSELCSSPLETEENATRYCRCDPDCDKTQDCCYDYTQKRSEIQNNIHQQSRGNADIKCTYVPILGWCLIVSSCASRSTQSPKVTSMSEQLCNGRSEVQPHMLDIPVTSATTRLTYKNIHCAICNEDAENLLPTKAVLLLDGGVSLKDAEYENGNLSWVQYPDYSSNSPHTNNSLEEDSGGVEDIAVLNDRESVTAILRNLFSNMNRKFSDKFHKSTFHEGGILFNGDLQESLEEGGSEVLQETAPLELISKFITNSSSRDAIGTLKDLLNEDVWSSQGSLTDSLESYMASQAELMMQWKGNKKNISASIGNVTRYWLYLDGEFIQPCENFVNSCDPDWERWGDDTYKLCLSYTMPVHAHAKRMEEIFKNPHCALCNHVAFSELNCLGIAQFASSNGKLDDLMFPQINFTFGNVTAGHINCGMRSVWDPLFNQCYYLDPADGIGNSITTSHPTSFPTNRSSSTKLKQSDPFHGEHSWKVDDHCKQSTLLTMSKVQWFLAYACFGVSIICLGLHLVSYAYPKDLLDFSQKENSNSFYSSRTSQECQQIAGDSFIILSWLLLIGQSLFTVGALRTEIREVCLAVAVLHNFLSLAAISWLSVFCLQVFKSHFSLRSFKSMISLQSGSEAPPLKLSLIAWIIPTVFSSLCLTLELVPGDLRPCLARGGACWYGETVSFRIFFVLPALLMLAGDGCIFTAIIFGIHDKKDRNSSTSTRRKSNSQHRRRSSAIANYDHRCFRLCARLGFIMAISWSCAAIASLGNLPSLWYGYVMFSGFQGIYIFLASGSKSRVTDLIRAKAKGQSEHVRRERSIKNNPKSTTNTKA